MPWPPRWPEAPATTHCPDIPRGYQTYDAMSAESITRLVDELRPSVIVLTEETSDVDYCEQHRMDAMEFNTRSVRFFVDAAQKAGSRVVYQSTPFVFDGRKPGGLYTESDKVNPINVYGETRLMGEVHVDKVPGVPHRPDGRAVRQLPGQLRELRLQPDQVQARRSNWRGTCTSRLY